MTKDAVRAGSGSGLSVAGWPLRRKMALALAIPLLLAATLGGLRVANDLAESSSSSTSANQVTVIRPAVDYLSAAETAMVAAQGVGGTSQGDLVDAIDDISTTASELEDTAKDADLTDLQTEQISAMLDLSQAMRAEDARTLGPATWVAEVRQLESSVNQLISSINAAQNTPEPRLEQLSQAVSGRMSLAMQQALVANADLAQSGSQELFSEIGVEAAAIDRLAAALGEEAAVADLRSANTEHAGEVRDDSATDLGGRDAYLPYNDIIDKLSSGVAKSLDTAAADARQSALIGAGLTLVALAAAVLLAIMIARSLLEPIGRVREGALAVARHRLPDAVARIRAGEEPEPIKTIDVHTNEEVGQVARAVDDLHRQALHLAAGEAQLRQTVNAMFVTLSRRSNSLVNQQLAQIERLEQDEEDPKRLESLFRLDHLASRMRRTADSLLILADAPNRSAGQFSLTVGESLQAATSGVQDYQRVQILSHLSTRVSEDAAADLVHLLTELVDNALTFSPPAEPVRLDAKLGADGATITVTDAGLGVPAAELESLNDDLAVGSEATPDTARRMGLFVVSRLARRHGIQAKLVRNPRGGMTASILLPPAILPELPQPAGKPAEVSAPAAVEPAAEEAKARKASRADKAAQKAEEKSAREAAQQAQQAEQEAAAKAKHEAAARDAAAATAASAATSSQAPAFDADRPPLDGLLPKREPGANLPRTGAEAFLPPETSTATGPLFGKRPAAPAADADQAKPAAEGGETPEQRVARVVPITALAARQRAQAELEAAQARGADEDETPADEPVEAPVVESPADEPVQEPVVEEPVLEEPAFEEPVEEPAAEQPRPHDPLNDPLPAEEQPAAAAEPEPETVPEPEPVVEPEPFEPAPVVEDEIEVDAADPLGLDRPIVAQAPQPAPEPEPEFVVEPEPEPEAEPEPEPVVSEPAARAAEPESGLGAGLADLVRSSSGGPSAPEAPAADGLAAGLAGGLAGSLAGGLSGGLPSRTPGAAAEINRDMPGLPSSTPEPARAGGESPIFKSMRSGWLAAEGNGEWHKTEVDRGWEIAEHVAEESPAAESTSAGLPVRQPGERLVPGSVTPPTDAKVRDPEAIRRRLSAHRAGVARGRQAANNSSQHTEAGPA